MRGPIRALALVAVAIFALPTTARATETITPPYTAADHDHDTGYEMLGDRADASASSLAHRDGTINLSATVTTKPLGGPVLGLRSANAYAYGSILVTDTVPDGTTNATYVLNFDVRKLAVAGRSGPILVDGTAAVFVEAYAGCDCNGYTGYYLDLTDGSPIENGQLSLEMPVVSYFESLPTQLRISVNVYVEVTGGHRAYTTEAAADLTLTSVDVTY